MQRRDITRDVVKQFDLSVDAMVFVLNHERGKSFKSDRQKLEVKLMREKDLRNRVCAFSLLRMGSRLLVLFL